MNTGVQAAKYAREVMSISNGGGNSFLNNLDTIHFVFITSWGKRRLTLKELRIAYMNPSQCDETLLILYEEKFFFVLSVAIIRPSALLRDKNVSNGKFIPHLLKREKSLSQFPSTYGTLLCHSRGKWNVYASESPASWIPHLSDSPPRLPMRMAWGALQSHKCPEFCGNFWLQPNRPTCYSWEALSIVPFLFLCSVVSLLLFL